MTENIEKTELEKVLDYLSRLEKKIDVLDQNVKILINNTRTPTTTPATKIPKTKQVAAAQKPVDTGKGFQNFKFAPSDASTVKHEEPLVQKNRNGDPFLCVTGKMVTNSDGNIIPLAGVDVKIFDEHDVLVKQTRTNTAGIWAAHLSPNQNYVALFEGEVKGRKIIPINKNFTTPINLMAGQIEFKVV